jgi:hypothetical protein
MARNTARSFEPGKGRRRVISSYKTMPKEKISERASNGSPRTYSGDM